MKHVKTIDALMKYLRETHNMNIGGSAQKRKLRNLGYYHGYIPRKTDAVGGDRGYKAKNYHEYLCRLCQSRGLTLLLCGGLVGLVALIALRILKILKILIILLVLI